MKSQFQTLSFLSNYTPKTPLDAEFIDSFLVQRFQITPKTPRFAPQTQSDPIDVQSFISWFENGSEALKIARFQNSVVLLGNCTLETCDIIASLSSEGVLTTEKTTVPASQIEEPSEIDIPAFQAALIAYGLQPSPNTLTLVPRYTPKNGDRVVFYDFSLEVQGVGVVRDIDPDNNVIFYCYFTYPTSSQPKRIGYSLYENPGLNICSTIFENIDKENVMTTIGNSTSCFRRLGRELEKVGKIWKDKMLRIEPIKVEQEVGAKYYYISDKLKVVTETEKGTPTSHIRYLSGNYFTSHMAATKMLGKFQELIRNYLASDKWPEVDSED